MTSEWIFENPEMTKEEFERLAFSTREYFWYNEGESVAYTLRSLRYSHTHEEFKQLVKDVHGDRDKLNTYLFQRCFVTKVKAPSPKPKVDLKASLDAMDENEKVCWHTGANNRFLKRFFMQVFAYMYRNYQLKTYKKMMEKYFDVTWLEKEQKN